MGIDITKEYMTTDGYEVRIYAVDGVGIYSVHGAIKTETGWAARTWTSDGMRYSGEGSSNLIEKPKTYVKWVNLYSNGVACTYSSKGYADLGAGDRIACVKIEFTEGEGLDD